MLYPVNAAAEIVALIYFFNTRNLNTMSYTTTVYGLCPTDLDVQPSWPYRNNACLFLPIDQLAFCVARIDLVFMSSLCLCERSV